jgi:hypothetical protein
MAINSELNNQHLPKIKFAVYLSKNSTKCQQTNKITEQILYLAPLIITISSI